MASAGASVSPRCVLVTSSSESSHASLFDTRSGSRVASFQGAACGQRCCTRVSEEWLLAASVSRPILSYWSWSREHAAVRCGGPEKVRTVSASSCGSFVAVGTQSGTIWLWDAQSGALLSQWSAHLRAVGCLGWTDDSSCVLSGSEDTCVSAWLVADVTDSQHSKPWRSFSRHTLPVTAIVVGVGGVGARAVSTSLDRSCKLWHLPSGQLLANTVFSTAITCAFLAPSADHVWVGGGEGKIFGCVLIEPAVSPTGGASLSASLTLHGHDSGCISMSGEGDMLISSSGADVKVWDLNSGQCVRQIPYASSPISNVILMETPQKLLEGSTPARLIPQLRKLATDGDRDINLYDGPESFIPLASESPRLFFDEHGGVAKEQLAAAQAAAADSAARADAWQRVGRTAQVCGSILSGAGK